VANKNLKAVVKRPGYASTPITEKADKSQVKNNAGGYSFTLTKLERAKRFLILGSDSSFYQSGATRSKENAESLIDLISDGGAKQLVDAIVEISTEGRAAKQDAGLFALAVASSWGTDEETRYALSKLSAVARTGTSLFVFLTYVEQFRGWGRQLSRAVGSWYTEKSADKLAYQMVKYRQREGWTHRDVFRKAHPKSDDATFQVLGEWVLRGSISNELPKVVHGYELAKDSTIKDLPALISEYGLTWDMIPTEALNDKAVWEALLEGNVPLGALVRQLPRLTNLGIIARVGGSTQAIVKRLTDEEEIKRSRLHPLNILVAQRTYESGKSLRGTTTWNAVPQIVAALEKAFYKSFKYAEPAGKRTLVALDVSGSMAGSWNYSEVASPLKPVEVGAALSLVLLNTEPDTHVFGFSHNFVELGIQKGDSLKSAMGKAIKRNFGGTDASLAIEYARTHNLEVDTFIVITDNDTWRGGHPHEVLQRYRRETAIDAKLVVMATESTPFTISDPNDGGMLDIAGFDSAVPQLITSFSKG